jgi:hypothetical protein
VQTEVRACVCACLRVGSKRYAVFVGCCACVGRIRARAIEYKRDRCRMSSIIRAGDTYHGISVIGRGVFTNDKYGRRTHAGQHKDGYACGLSVATSSDGSKVYAEHGPDGKCVGRYLDRSAHGDTYYSLFERGEQKDFAYVSANGTYMYNYVACAPDDPRLLALIAQVAPVEVRPAAPARHPPSARPPATKPSSDGSAGSFFPPQALAAAVATEVHTHSARRRWWLRDTAQQQPHCKARPRSDACAGFFAVRVSREARTLLHPNNRRLVHTNRPV